MIFILISVCFSVFVSVLLKLAKRYDIDNKQAIAWNYSIAGLLTWLIYRPELPSISESIFPIYFVLGFLLPSLFVILAFSIRYTGIVKTDIAQRLSLFIPVIASFLLFYEEKSPLKIIGIAIAFMAIIFSIPWKKETNAKKSFWIYPVLVFIGMGIIDTLFKQIAKTTTIPFTSSLLVVFIIAFVLSFSYLLYLYLFKNMKFTLINMVCGWILGIANFGNILFYMKAHQDLAKQPSLVFSTMNIGVILLGSAVGVFIFREKLSRLNYVGILLALISILFLYYAQ
ncbi:EamA/RhaT family transporter [Daejeonella sp.]|jgi:drug/metabolite transporter (DMT)-like permease|uniref:EamA/RhaT family transporter n=1 Tax=Daejeonella sp. TaxID=2805397 RepID=UPI0027B9EE92|nr:EamA/RhaT family transporter [Daejeonella sp.]